MKIAICDDEKLYCEKLYREIKELTLQWKNLKEIFVCYDGSSLEEAHKKYIFDIILLDVDLGKDNGFEVAKYVRNISKHCKIIFLSNHEEWVQDAFKVHAYRYIYKSKDCEDGLKEAIQSAYKELQQDKYILIPQKDKLV